MASGNFRENWPGVKIKRKESPEPCVIAATILPPSNLQLFANRNEPIAFGL
jgi:hypothetical protein